MTARSRSTASAYQNLRVLAKMEARGSPAPPAPLLSTHSREHWKRPMNSQRLLERFLRYVQIDTTAREGTGSYPSSPGQLELGRMLVEELRNIGLADAAQDAYGIVLATIPATRAGATDTIAFNSHLDTSPETTGAGVKPQVIRNYSGGDIPLPGAAGRVIRAADNPELAALLGKTLITTDGTTLLGADDKAGVAVIMETANWLDRTSGDSARADPRLFHLRRRDWPRRRSRRPDASSAPWSVTRWTARGPMRSTARRSRPIWW